LGDILIISSARIRQVEDQMRMFSDTSALSMIEVRRDVVAWNPSHLLSTSEYERHCGRPGRAKVERLVMLAAKPT
jgi:hypothetical protein